MFQFPSSVAGGELGYLCAAPPVPRRATKARARKIPAAYEVEIRNYDDTFAAELVGTLKAGTSPKATALFGRAKPHSRLRKPMNVC